MCDRHGSLGRAIHNLFGEADAKAEARAEVPARPINRRLKLWELEEKHHCPVVGTCLKLEDIKKIARQSGFGGRDFDEYTLHVEAVSVSLDRNPTSEAMHKLLDRRYDLFLRRFEKARTVADVLALWKQHLERGEVAGAMWAALTHKAGSRDVRHAVYADVHMLSHQVGAGQAADLRRLEWLDREYARLIEREKAESARHGREISARDARIQQLERETVEIRQRAQEASPLRQRLEALESGLAMTDMARRLMNLTDEAARLRERNAALQARVDALDAECRSLREEIDAATREHDALERMWLGDPQGDGDCDGECLSCPSQLHGRCVLCVGGRTPLLPQYRQLAERLGVRLIHHDGGKEESLSRLPALLASSDAVICPTDCVSHPAYFQLKQHCKQAGKPCVLARTSGVASFAAALARLAEGRAEIQPD